MKPYDYEHSEMLLYQNMVMTEAGMYQEALDHLQQYDKQLVDRVTVQEHTGTHSVYYTHALLHTGTPAGPGYLVLAL